MAIKEGKDNSPMFRMGGPGGMMSGIMVGGMYGANPMMPGGRPGSFASVVDAATGTNGGIQANPITPAFAAAADPAAAPAAPAPAPAAAPALKVDAAPALSAPKLEPSGFMG